MKTLQRSNFDALADAVCSAAKPGERSSLLLKAEASDFIRFNRAAVRQATKEGTLRGAQVDIAFLDYDWKLNDAR